MREIPLEELLCDFTKRKGRSPEYFLNILNGEDMKEWIVKENKEELIRCKDCIYKDTMLKKMYEHNFCDKFGQAIEDNDYCSWAEPKDVLEKIDALERKIYDR